MDLYRKSLFVLTPWRNTNSTQVSIYRTKIMTTCRVVYLSNFPEGLKIVVNLLLRVLWALRIRFCDRTSLSFYLPANACVWTFPAKAYVSLGLCILRMARYVGVCMRLYMCVYSTYPYFGWTDVVSQATTDGGVVYLF